MAPLFVIVPGAWHTDSVSALIDQLMNAGFDAVAAQLPSVGTLKGLADDTAYLRDTIIRALLAAGKELILVFHSYAGFPGSAAISGLGRETALSGRIVGLIYLAAFLPQEGVTLQDMMGGTLPDWQDIDEDTGFTGVKNPEHIFYNDVSEEVATQAARQLQVHSVKSFREPAGPPGFTDKAYDGRRVFVRTTKDNCFPTAYQDGSIQGSGVAWTVQSVATSHSPFLSMPEEVAKIMIEFANEWS